MGGNVSAPATSNQEDLTMADVWRLRDVNGSQLQAASCNLKSKF